MIHTPPKPRYAPGTRLRITQRVRVGGREWTTQIEGVLEHEGLRPIGGMEMGGKSVYCHQPALRLRNDDGTVTVVAIDEDSRIETIAGA
jgi:hypothetical protein